MYKSLLIQQELGKLIGMSRITPTLTPKTSSVIMMWYIHTSPFGVVALTVYEVQHGPGVLDHPHSVHRE